MRRAFVIHQLSRVDEDAPLLSSPERRVSEACQKSCMMKIYAISALKLTHQAVSFVRKNVAAGVTQKIVGTFITLMAVPHQEKWRLLHYKSF